MNSLVKFSKNLIIFCFYFFLLSFFMPGFAKEIQVEIFNKTSQKPQNVEALELLELKSTMQVIQVKKNPGASSVFTNIKTDDSAPLMIRALFGGIYYSKIIPPGSQEKKYNLDVYETKNEYGENIKFGKVYSVVYTEKKLVVDVFLNFINGANYTFSEQPGETGTGGIFFFLPEKAENITASVSVGEGKSDIRWLRITPEKIKTANGTRGKKATHLLPYPLKPGDRSYHIQYQIPYDGKETTLPVREIYRQKNPVRLIFRPSDLKITAANADAFKLKQDPESNIEYLEFNSLIETEQLMISGGTPVPDEAESADLKNQNQNVIYKQSITLGQRILLIIITLVLLSFFIFFIGGRKKLLIKIWQKQLLKNEVLLELQIKQGSPKLAKIEKIKEKIQTLKRNLIITDSMP